MWKNVKNELPTNTFECIVKMWNKFNDTWVTGIGIYDVPTEQWEIQDNGVVANYPVHFWFETPELEEQLRIGDVSVSFLYDFVNEFTDTEIPKEAINETLNQFNER